MAERNCRMSSWGPRVACWVGRVVVEGPSAPCSNTNTHIGTGEQNIFLKVICLLARNDLEMN